MPIYKALYKRTYNGAIVEVVSVDPDTGEVTYENVNGNSKTISHLDFTNNFTLMSEGDLMRDFYPKGGVPAMLPIVIWVMIVILILIISC